MNLQAELVRIDKEIEAVIRLAPAEAARRLLELYRTANSQEPFVVALVGRLLLLESTRGL